MKTNDGVRVAVLWPAVMIMVGLVPGCGGPSENIGVDDGSVVEAGAVAAGDVTAGDVLATGPVSLEGECQAGDVLAGDVLVDQGSIEVSGGLGIPVEDVHLVYRSFQLDPSYVEEDIQNECAGGTLVSISLGEINDSNRGVLAVVQCP
ncbi:MAG: hypothetical protein KKI08_16550 [Armatimonadetes bacterium]|nr:hypothetical protein [Armatimonadota bacterium]